MSISKIIADIEDILQNEELNHNQQFILNQARDMLFNLIDEWDERRVDIIGSNGNEGLHYE